jgi:hypothetical protein
MIDLRAEMRQSCGDVKPRNVRGRCQKTTTSRRADCGEHRQAAGATVQSVRIRTGSGLQSLSRERLFQWRSIANISTQFVRLPDPQEHGTVTSEEFYDHGTCRYNGIIHGGSVYVPKTIFGRVGRNCALTCLR